MPLGVLETYDNDESGMLYGLLNNASHDYPVDSRECYVLAKAMADTTEYDPMEGAQQYDEGELSLLYGLLAVASHAYSIDSDQFHVLTKAMADFREQM